MTALRNTGAHLEGYPGTDNGCLQIAVLCAISPGALNGTDVDFLHRINEQALRYPNAWFYRSDLILSPGAISREEHFLHLAGKVS
jgi:hypothetical protein